jgi:hypothetical protein
MLCVDGDGVAYAVVVFTCDEVVVMVVFIW